MRKVIYNKYDKALIGGLPQVLFPGEVVVIVDAAEADRAVDFLLSHPLLGVDTETRPSFRKGKQNRVALLQVATPQRCFLFRLNRLGLVPSVVRLLEDKRTLKVGLSLHDDLLSLHRLGAFTAGRFADLQDLMTEIGIEDKSLQKLYANLFHEKISKRQQLSNWESDTLSEKQKGYAATDAWACINLYNEYNRLRETGDYQLVISEAKKEEYVQESISEEG